MNYYKIDESTIVNVAGNASIKFKVKGGDPQQQRLHYKSHKPLKNATSFDSNCSSSNQSTADFIKCPASSEMGGQDLH